MHLPSENPHHTFILHVHQDNCVSQWQFHAAYRSIWVARMQANHPVLQGVCIIAGNLSPNLSPTREGSRTEPPSHVGRGFGRGSFRLSWRLWPARIVGWRPSIPILHTGWAGWRLRRKLTALRWVATRLRWLTVSAPIRRLWWRWLWWILTAIRQRRLILRGLPVSSGSLRRRSGRLRLPTIKRLTVLRRLTIRWRLTVLRWLLPAIRRRALCGILRSRETAYGRSRWLCIPPTHREEKSRAATGNDE